MPYSAAVSSTDKSLLTGASLNHGTPRGGTRGQIVSWCLWDFGSNAYNTVMLSFVFSVYVTTAAAPDERTGQQVFANLQTIAGICVAVLAPVIGVWADRVRRRRPMLSVATLGVVAAMTLCWFVKPYDEASGLTYLYLGAALIAGANMLQQVAEIFYNSMLVDLSTPRTVGRISGAAWGLGYLGGVLTLALTLVLFVLNDGVLGVPTEQAMNYRAIALFCAAWLLVMSVPVMLWGPPSRPGAAQQPLGVIGAYRHVGRHLLGKLRQTPHVLVFLASSAVYRDGLAAVFAFAGVIAATSYGMDPTQIIIFGLAANFAAALGAWALGLVDDLVGPRFVIATALLAMVVLGVAILAVPTTWMFWIGGMGISALVGPVQSASRTLLTRIVQPGEENEMFGLYNTVGRAASWIAPALIGVFTAWLGTRLGLLGIVVTLAAGLVLFWQVRIDGVTHNRRAAG